MWKRSQKCTTRFSTRKKFLQEIFLSVHFKCRCLPCRPPTNNSSMPISGGSFLKGFLAYAMESGTRIARDHDEISYRLNQNQLGNSTISGGTAGTASQSYWPRTHRYILVKVLHSVAPPISKIFLRARSN